MRHLFKSSLAVSALGFATLAGCSIGEGSDVGTNANLPYEEFEARVYKEPWDGGVYVMNGDTPVTNGKRLFEAWESTQQGGLAVDISGGSDNKWSDAQKLNLTYCVSDAFGANKATMVEALRQATDLGWETMGNVNFVYVSAQDANCTASNPNVLFDIRPVSGQPYLARAFFPDSPRSARNVLVDTSSFGNTGWPLKNIIAHELGHALGFRHEHTRPEAGTCFEDNNFRPLTPYDAASVMHYPQCNGTSANLSFTQRDIDGIKALYGAPGSGNGGGGGGGTTPPTPPPSTGGTKTFSGSVTQGQFVSHQMTVTAGSTLKVVMTGTGDPDLYVRFGQAPTTRNYACRPYLDGAAEECTLTVPSGQTTAYLGVRGYTAATYTLTATN